MTTQTYRIRLEGIEKSYPTEGGQLRVLDEISLEIRDGEFLSIVGPSGCGKSTLLNIIVDWIAPDAGTVDIAPSRSDVQLGFVFQEPTLLDWRTVRQNLSFALRGLGVPEAKHDRQINTALELVKLSETADRYPPSLSGGMRQRVNFARAFCVGPDVLLMDEPFSSLDELTARGLRERVVNIWGEKGFTAILVTHDISEAVYFSDRVLVLSDTPTTIEDMITIDSDRPRDLESKEIINIMGRGTIIVIAFEYRYMVPRRKVMAGPADKCRSRREFIRATAALGVGIGVGGCLGRQPGNGSTNDGSRTVIDGAGRTVTLPETVERVICVGPGTLRQIAYLHATNRVVGVEAGEKQFLKRAPYNMANPGLRELPTIGSTGPNAGGNSEKILAQNPDVIFYFGDPAVAADLTEQTNTPVVVLTIVDIVNESARRTMYDTWRLVGKVLHKSDRASKLVGAVRGFVEHLESRAPDLSKPEQKPAYIGAINYKGAQGLATTRNPFPPFRLTNTRNVAKGVETNAPSVQVSHEKLLQWNPPRAFVSTRNAERVKADIQENPELQRIDAVERKAVYKILPYAQYHVNYESIIANSFYVGTTVYPNDYGDISIPEKTNQITQAFLDTSLYEQLARTHHMFEPLSISS